MWAKFLSMVKGWKTIVFSGLLVVAGILLAVLQSINLDMITLLLPDKYKPFAPVIGPLLVSVIGVIVGWLRMVTDTPLGKAE